MAIAQLPAAWPTFEAALSERHPQGVPAILEDKPVRFRLGQSEATELPVVFAGEPWKIHVRCNYRDGDERFASGVLVLNPADLEEAGRGVSARYADGRLYVQSSR